MERIEPFSPNGKIKSRLKVRRNEIIKVKVFGEKLKERRGALPKEF